MTPKTCLSLALIALLFAACDDGGGSTSADTSTDGGDATLDGAEDTLGDTAEATGSIAGTLTTSDGGDPTGATITLLGESATVDGEGAYTFDDIPLGTHGLVASLEGYITHSEQVTVTADETTTVDITLDPATPPNSPPVVTALFITPNPLPTGSTGTATAIATDPEGDPLTYTWEVTGGDFTVEGSGDTATVTAPSTEGTGVLTLTVSDDKEGSIQATLDLDTGAGDNTAPEITEVQLDPGSNVDPGAVITLTVTATDADGDPLTYALESGNPDWTWTSNDNVATVTAPNAFGSSANVIITVSDDRGAQDIRSTTLNTMLCADPELLDCDNDASNGCEARDSGAGRLCPAPSCRHIVGHGYSSANGVYWLSPTGFPSGAFSAYCIMGFQGGGWTILGTISGADDDNWNTEAGYWADENTLGDPSQPWGADFKSEAWYSYDLTGAELLYQRRYDGATEARAILDPACLMGKSTFNELFTTFDTARACTADQITVVRPPRDPWSGLASADFAEGNAIAGLGSAQTNGLCWNGQDTAVNTFSGHVVWVEGASEASCDIGTHVGGVGVFENDFDSFENADITGTTWLTGTDYTKTDITFAFRERATLAGALTADDPGHWSDGSAAASCLAYLNPPSSGYITPSSPTDGIYSIDPDGYEGPIPRTSVFCDMTTDGGGWTALTANGENASQETTDPGDCYPLVSDQTDGCGTASDMLSDFVLPGSVQGGVSWRRMLGVAYGDSGYDEKLGYFAIDFGSSAATTEERINGKAYVPRFATAPPIIACTNTVGMRIIHYTKAGTYNSRPGEIADGRGTVFGHNTVTTMNSSARRTFGFTDRVHSGTNTQLLGIDDYQDGWSCSDIWQPRSARGARMVILVR